MSSSGNVLKSNFIKFTGSNTRVIDSSALVAKRLEGFTGVLRERAEEEVSYEPVYDEEGNLIPQESIDMLTGEETVAEEEVIPSEPTPEDIKESLDQMIAEAQAEADRIIEKANETAEAIKNTARDEGLAEGRELATSELLELKAELADEQNRIKTEYENLVATLEPQMVEVITDIYNHVFGNSLYSRKDVMICLVNKALMHIESNDQVVVYVCPADYDMIVENRNQLIEKTAFQTPPEIIQRDDFEKGQAKIETPFGILDCSIDTELKELSKTLKALSFEGKG